MIFSFIGFLLFFMAIGLLAARHGKNDHTDYYLAGRTVKPWAVGLSGVATNNSGYMFIGMVGYAYAVGLASIWIGVGLVIGDFLASLRVHKRFRQVAETTGKVSYAGVLSAWHDTDYTLLRRLIGLFSLVFLLAYASAQLNASNKLIQVIGGADWPEYSGACIAAAVIAVYCLRGGMRASIWTDVAQSLLMLTTALVLVFSLAYASSDLGVFGIWRQIPGFLSLLHPNLMLPGILGGIVFAVSWGFAGVSVIGQPHIMSRFMTLDKADNYHRCRPWYYFFYIIMYISVIGIGLLARIHFPELGAHDPELAMPFVAKTLFSPVLAGIIIAGVFAAAMSTADSQIISCSSILARDLMPGRLKKSWTMQLATLISIAAALAFTIINNQSIFNLVILAWSAMGAMFGPLLLVYVCNGRPTQAQAISMVITGLLTVIIWRALEWHHAVYEGMPAILLSLTVYAVWSLSRLARQK